MTHRFSVGDRVKKANPHPSYEHRRYIIQRSNIGGMSGLPLYSVIIEANEHDGPGKWSTIYDRDLTWAEPLLLPYDPEQQGDRDDDI